MKTPPPLDNEAQRVHRLHALGLLDTEAEAALDSFTGLAADVTGMPIALISLIDHDRQWFKSAVGLPQGAGTPRELSFCGHAIASDDIMEVEDATRDERFHDNPAVVGPPHVRFYAGAPLVMPGGERIGTLCVVGHEPAQLQPHTRALLSKLARGVVDVLLLRESERTLGARVQAERALRESEARFRTITDATPQMVWSARADGELDYHNQRWFDFTGAAENATANQGWRDLVHPEDVDSTARTWEASLRSGEPYEMEFRLRHHSGEFRWVLGRALALRDDTGAVVRWMGTCTDIHDQKLTQQELQSANQRKDEFLAMLAHELRNPLAPISTAAQILRIAPDDSSKVLRASELISRQVQHMTSLVDDLLDVSRVTRGLVQIEQDLVDLNQVVQAAMEQARPHTEARQQQAQASTLPQPVLVRGDRVRLTQVVSNLLNNAAKYTPVGGHIGVELSLEGAQALIRVTDNGSGIEPALLPHVFELFTQAQRTPDRRQGGLGLGLALVRSLVERHGGRVRADSAGHGQGSQFRIWLPLVKADSRAASSEPHNAPAPTRPLHIMVVDDNEDAAQMLGVWLETQGHQVRVHTGSLQALEAARHQPAEVYVLDIGLPEMDGYELARRIRQEAGGRQAVLAALTGYGQARDISQSREAGFDFHFVKPVDPARLAHVLAGVARQPAESRGRGRSTTDLR